MKTVPRSVLLELVKSSVNIKCLYMYLYISDVGHDQTNAAGALILLLDLLCVIY